MASRASVQDFHHIEYIYILLVMSVHNHIPPQNIEFTMHPHKDIQIKYPTTAILFTVLFIVSIYIFGMAF